MSRLLDDDQDLLEQSDRELTLSTGAILAIFLGLVLLCAVFFGFGYNLGRKSTVSIPGATATEPSSEPGTAASSTNFDSFKPSPSSPAAASHNNSSPAPASSGLPSVTVPAVPSAATPKPTSASPPVAPPAPREPTAAAHSISTAPAPAHATAATPAAATVRTGSFMVQVAAVTRQDDANLLMTALRTKGYTVAARSSPQDKLLHIQVGPFATRADAEAMREKLIIDGYNAIVK